MKEILFLIVFISYANEFKDARKSYYSPLSYTVNKIKKDKKENLKITPNTFKNNLDIFKKFNRENSNEGNWKFKINYFTNTISSISGDSTSKKYYGSIEEASRNFLIENEKILNVDFSKLRKITESNFYNTSHIYFIQTYNGLDIEFSYVKIHRNNKNEISYYSSRYYPKINLDTNPKIKIEQALDEIKKESEYQNFKISTYTLVIYPDELNEKFYLAYKIEGYGGTGLKNGNWVFYIDAISGKILFKYDKRQYICQMIEETSGTIRGYVYEISPIPEGNPTVPWVSPVLKNFKDLYIFSGSYLSSTTTKSNGEYCIDHDPGEIGGKVFFTILGPYFSIVDYTGNYFFLTNGTYQIKSTPASLSVNSYLPNSILSYNITPNLNIPSGQSLAFVTPFFSVFNIGDIDQYGNSNDIDVLYLLDSNNQRISSFIGKEKNNFTAGLVPSNSYNIKLITNESGSGNFSITASTYIIITNPTGKNNATGSFVISTSPITNTFYHLTAIRDFIMKFNSKCSGNCIDLDKRVPVNVNVYSGNTPVYNAFYDLVHDAIYIGRGPIQNDLNFAWDGTVIRHEYIHLVMNRIYPIIYFGEFGAITEAISDYFALSSFWDEGKTLSIVGNFLGIGEGARRDISSVTKKMPFDWKGEVHEDGQILSGVLYKLAKNPQYSLGTFTSGNFSGLSKTDVYVFGSMFYFPDSFEGFMEAMIDLCKTIESTGCEEQKIRNAFAAHGIISDYTIVDKYEPNNGPTYAIDISSLSKIIAYIDYSGDEDYYALSLNSGIFHLKLELPKHNIGLYHAYTIFLFDEYGKPLAYQMPPTKSDLCYPPYNPQYTETCLTREPINEFYYYISTPGIYYISVTPGLNADMGPGTDYNRNFPYILTYDGKLNTSLIITKLTSIPNQDVFEFKIKIPKFYYNTSIAKNWKNGEVFEFCEKDCIQILDIKMNELSKNFISITDQNDLSGIGANYYTIDTDGSYMIKGKIKFQNYLGQTFSQKYPYVGTIYFKIMAKNHMFEIGNKNNNYINLGISDKVNLTGSNNEFITYNNVINESNTEIIINLESKNNSNIRVSVYTPTGTLIKKLYNGNIFGKMTLIWDGTNEKNEKLPSGIYYIKTEGAINKVEKVGIIR
ncbi:MAG: hypothetical protein N2Z20_04495 [Elusimicrobiales bacterium]|nr:hypothetical protein [Elusimicrobiales bacterium]